MATTKFNGSTVRLNGELPPRGSVAPNIRFVKADLSEADLASFKGEVLVLFTVPSLDTGVCAMETRTFNERLAGLGARALVVSHDLPFAMKRFCTVEGIERVEAASDFRLRQVGRAFGVEMEEGPFAGLLARAVFVIDREGVVRHVHLVPEIGQEPDYDEVLAEVRQLL